MESPASTQRAGPSRGEPPSPYRAFSRATWAAFSDHAPMTLTTGEIAQLRSLNDRLDPREVEEIYLPLSRLLSLYVAATQQQFHAQQRFLGTEDVLQRAHPPRDGQVIPFVSDFFDFSIYVDADEELLRRWYVDRFLTLRETTFRDPRSHFHTYATLSDREAVDTATSIWTRINLVNLRENIGPTRLRADLILRKGDSHRVQDVALRRL